MTTKTILTDSWVKSQIKRDQVEKYLNRGRHFIDQEAIDRALASKLKPSESQIKDILDKSLAIETLELKETALLLSVEDKDLLAEWLRLLEKLKRRFMITE